MGNSTNTFSANPLNEKIEKIEIKDSSYLKSYPDFIKYFEKIEGKFAEHNLIIGIHLVYGWMPTIFSLKNGKSKKSNTPFEKTDIQENISQSVSILNKVKFDNYTLKREDYVLLKKLLNNSLVGTSKLLHFINPEKYAIWDSNVFIYLNQDYVGKSDASFRNKIENEDNYIKYLTYLEELSVNPKFDAYYETVIQKLSKLGYSEPISKLRTLELIMFSKGQLLKQKSSVE